MISKGKPFAMSLPFLNRITLIIGLLFLIIGIGSVALTIQQPLSTDQWAQWTSGGEAPRAAFTGRTNILSRDWSYDEYLTAHAEANHARRACALSSFDGSICALGGFAALFTLLGLIVTAGALGLFYLVRTRTDAWKVA